MKTRPHVIFNKSQHTISLDIPNDVLYDLLSLSKQLNSVIKNGYRLNPDELVCMGMEDFAERYLSDIHSLLKRVEGK